MALPIWLIEANELKAGDIIVDGYLRLAVTEAKLQQVGSQEMMVAYYGVGGSAASPGDYYQRTYLLGQSLLVARKAGAK